MSRGDLPPYQDRKELIVVPHRGSYLEAGTMNYLFSSGAAFWSIPVMVDFSVAPLRGVDPSTAMNSPISQTRRIDLRRVQLNVMELGMLEPYRFRAWEMRQSDAEEIVRHRDFTAIIGGRHYDIAPEPVPQPVVGGSMEDELIRMLETTRAFGVELVAARDVRNDSVIIAVASEDRALVSIHRSELIRLGSEYEVSRYVAQLINDALERRRREEAPRQINTKQQPVAEPEVIVSMMRQRRINLGED